MPATATPVATPEEPADETLVAAVARGDRAALGALFDRFHGVVFRFVARLSGADSAHLDDLVQATFLEGARVAGSFRGRSAVRTWVLGIANNIVRHHVRAEARRRRRVESVARDRERGSDLAPDELASQRQLLARLAQALSRANRGRKRGLRPMILSSHAGLRARPSARFRGRRSAPLCDMRSRQFADGRREHALRLPAELVPGGARAERRSGTRASAPRVRASLCASVRQFRGDLRGPEVTWRGSTEFLTDGSTMSFSA
jgi:RNA polymerase sigma-70 factor (ECF subfamily)